MKNEEVKRLISCIDVRIDLIISSVITDTIEYSGKELSEYDIRLLVNNNINSSQPYKEIKDFLRELDS